MKQIDILIIVNYSFSKFRWFKNLVGFDLKKYKI